VVSESLHVCSHESHHEPWVSALREEKIHGAVGCHYEMEGNLRIFLSEPG
jgi:hypothetical protein